MSCTKTPDFGRGRVVTDDICFASATELASQIRAGDLSPVTVVDAFLDRIDQVNEDLTAYVTVREEKAREEAREAKRAVDEGAIRGPLHGVPVAIKDLTRVSGVRTTFGSPAFAEHVPDGDDTVVERLKGAGAIVLGKTNTPEFGRKTVTENPVFGPSRNPWNPSKVTGGSTGGSAAAVAAGLAPVALGSDAAGSIRIPSSACGVVGFMPDFGRVPFGPVRADAFENILPYTFLGPIARTTEDAALVMDVIGGPATSDPYSLPESDGTYRSDRDFPIDDLEVGYAPRFGDFEVSGDVLDVVGGALDRIEAAGADVMAAELTFPHDWETRHKALETFLQARYVGLYRNLKREHDVDLLRSEKPITPEVQSRIEKGLELGTGDLARARHVRTDTHDVISAPFDSYDVLVTATLGRTPFAIGDKTPTVDGTDVHPMHGWTLTWPLNLSGHPACSVPAGFSDDELPVGMQVIGPRRSDRTVLAASAAIETTLQHDKERPSTIDPL